MRASKRQGGSFAAGEATTHLTPSNTSQPFLKRRNSSSFRGWSQAATIPGVETPSSRLGSKKG
jgi:hypothetical protein